MKHEFRQSQLYCCWNPPLSLFLSFFSVSPAFPAPTWMSHHGKPLKLLSNWMGTNTLNRDSLCSRNDSSFNSELTIHSCVFGVPNKTRCLILLVSGKICAFLIWDHITKFNYNCYRTSPPQDGDKTWIKTCYCLDSYSILYKVNPWYCIPPCIATQVFLRLRYATARFSRKA